MKAIIFDVETTGLTLPSVAPLNKQPKIIELGVLKIEFGTAKSKKPKIIGELSQLLHPGEPISAEITKITGLTNNDLEGQPTFDKFLFTLRTFFNDTDVLIAHNALFDSALLRYDLQRAECKDFPWPKITICTVQEYRSQFGKRPKLTELYKQIIGKELVQTHRALDDCKALYEVLVADSFFESLLL